MPDINVWLALSWANHRHSGAAWTWFSAHPGDAFLFCRLSQLGLLRLLATASIMGKDVLTIAEAWNVYDRWLADSRVGIRPEPAATDAAFRTAARTVAKLVSPKALGDCYLMAISQSLGATLVTLDRALAAACAKARQPVAFLE